MQKEKFRPLYAPKGRVFMCKLLSWAREKIKTFTLMDIGLLKVCLLSLGLFIGVRAVEKGRKLSPLFFLTYLGTMAALFYRMCARQELILPEQMEDDA